MTRIEVVVGVQRAVAAVAHIHPDEVDRSSTLQALGISDNARAAIAYRLNAEFGVHLTSPMMSEFRTIGDIIDWIWGKISGRD